MATRTAKLQFESLADFLSRWKQEIEQGSVFIDAASAPSDLAPEFKLDIGLPLGMRIGPFQCQIVHRGADGSVGCRIPEVSGKVNDDIAALFQLLDDSKAWLIADGQVVSVEDVPDVAALERQLKEALAKESASTPADAATTSSVAAESAPATGPRVRGYPLPDLAGREADAQGSLSDASFRDLLIELAVQRSTGLLTLVGQDGTKRWGFWLKGGPVGWRSDPIQPEETLGVLLLKAGHLQKEQLAESLKIMEAQNIRQGEALIEMGILSFGQLVSLLEKQVEFVLQKVLQLGEGRWVFHSVENFAERFVNPAARVPSILYRGLRDHSREMPREELMTKHKPNLDLYIRLSDETAEIVEEIQFSSAEAKFLDVIRSNSWRLRELFTVTNLSRSQTACVLWALDELNILEYRNEENLKRYLDRISSRILSKNKSLSAASHFDVMEVHWICLQDEVETAYERLTKEFDVNQYKNLTEELHASIGRIRDRVQQAYEFLKIKRNRMAYREEILEADTIFNSAELLAKKGEMAIMKNDSREAVTCFAKASELVPNNTTFKDGLQRARGIAG